MQAANEKGTGMGTEQNNRWMWNEYRRDTEHIQKRNKMDAVWADD